MDDPTNLFTGVLAIFTVFLFSASVWQGYLTKRSVGSPRAITDLKGPFIDPVIEGNNVWGAFREFVVHDHPRSPHAPVSPL